METDPIEAVSLFLLPERPKLIPALEALVGGGGGGNNGGGGNDTNGGGPLIRLL